MAKRKNTSLRFFPNRIIFFTGCGLILFRSIYLLYKKTTLSFSALPRGYTVSQSLKNNAISIEIPSLNISLPVTEATIIKGIWQTSQHTASHLSYSASPGDSGNIIIYGHNYNSIFGPLIRTKIGDSILITTKNGLTYVYTITQTMTVKPEDIEIIKPTAYELLTVYTCSGFLDTNRFVIQAKPFIGI